MGDALDRGIEDRWQALQGRLPPILADRDPIVLGVVAIAIVGLIARIVLLGARPAHFDEGRVAHWTLHFLDTGHFEYRHIIHGPFVQHVGRWVFYLFGANDFTMRLPVAIVGGLLPVGTLLYRNHLRDHEVLIAAIILTISPILLYYSRFMRSDLLVATFMFVALGALVKLADTGRVEYFYVAAIFAGFGLASKENGILYPLTWVGGFGLILGHLVVRELLHRVETDRLSESLPSMAAGPVDAVLGGRDVRAHLLGGMRKRAVAVGRSRGEVADASIPELTVPVGEYYAARYAGDVMLAIVVLLFVLLFMFAPRGAGMAGVNPPSDTGEYPVGDTVGFWEGVTDIPNVYPGEIEPMNVLPGRPQGALDGVVEWKFTEMIGHTTDRVISEYQEWLPAVGEDRADDEPAFTDEYKDHAGFFLQVLGKYTWPTLAAALIGFVALRFAGRDHWVVPTMLTYAGAASIVGYPAGMDIEAAWIATHVLVPLSIPAAIGLGTVIRAGWSAHLDHDALSVGLAVVFVLASGGYMATTGVNAAFIDPVPDDDPLVQYAQPADMEMRQGMDTMDRLVQVNDGTDVVLYGSGIVGDLDTYRYTRPLCMGRNGDGDGGWWDTLPLGWYFYYPDPALECHVESGGLQTAIENDVPVIVTMDGADDQFVRQTTDEYVSATYRLRASSPDNPSADPFVMFFHEPTLDAAGLDAPPNPAWV
ncbi:flippase activity-associated protein Agl23 [Halococcoides cellulosivorans]|nr:flippase activity-associated protein Agl23 [Halococcoides cellulosivorans]